MSWVDSSRERDIQLLGSVYRKTKDSLDRWEPIPLELTAEELDRLVSVIGRRVSMMEKTQAEFYALKAS